jgi:hypothetical protein
VASAPSRFGAGGRFFHPLGDEREPSARDAGSEQNSVGRCPRRTLKRSVSELQREKWLAVWNLADAKPAASPHENDFERATFALKLARPRARPVCKPRLKPECRPKLTDLRLHHPHRPPPKNRCAWYRRTSPAVATFRSAARKLPGLYLMRTATLAAGSPSAATRSKNSRPRRLSSSARTSDIHGSSPVSCARISTSLASTMSARSSRWSIVSGVAVAAMQRSAASTSDASKPSDSPA